MFPYLTDLTQLGYCSCETSKMDSLFKTTLLRTLGFLFVALLSPLLFIHVEYTEKDDGKEKYKMLHLLYESMSSKCSITVEEFNNFTNVAYEALSEPRPQWTYYHATDFVLQALTTIGKGNIWNKARPRKPNLFHNEVFHPVDRLTSVIMLIAFHYNLISHYKSLPYSS